MWWFEAVVAGFSYPASSIQICLFRVVLAIAVWLKFGYEHGRGAWHYFAADSYVRYRFHREHPRLPIRENGYRTLYTAKFVAATGLLIGVAPRAAALVLAAWFFFEMCYDRKFHTAYLGLCALFLATSPALADALTYRTLVQALALSPVDALQADAARTTSDVFAQVLLVLLTSQMYLSTAYRKLRSGQFMSGSALHSFTASLHGQRHAQRYRDTWYPSLMVRHLIDVPAEVAHRRWRVAAAGTVVLECALPAALFVPELFAAAVVAGALMHAAFTVVLPVRLPPFSVATVGSYLLFVDPATVTAWIGG